MHELTCLLIALVTAFISWSTQRYTGLRSTAVHGVLSVRMRRGTPSVKYRLQFSMNFREAFNVPINKRLHTQHIRSSLNGGGRPLLWTVLLESSAFHATAPNGKAYRISIDGFSSIP
jgi:hypothetical protein